MPEPISTIWQISTLFYCEHIYIFYVPQSGTTWQNLITWTLF